MDHATFMAWLGQADEPTAVVKPDKKCGFKKKTDTIPPGTRIRFHNGIIAEIIHETKNKDYLFRRFKVNLLERGNPSVKNRGPNAARQATQPRPIEVSENEFIFI